MRRWLKPKRRRKPSPRRRKALPINSAIRQQGGAGSNGFGAYKNYMMAEDRNGNAIMVHPSGSVVVHLGENFHGSDFRPFMREVAMTAEDLGAAISKGIDGRVFVDADLILRIADLAGYEGTKRAIQQFVDTGVQNLAQAEASKGMN